jgi:hypothetical protein
LHYQAKIDDGVPTTIELPNTPRVEPKLEHHMSGRTPVAPSAHTLTAQTDAIEGVKSGNVKLDEFPDGTKRPKGNNVRSGNFGEMATDNDLVNRGLNPLHERITGIDTPIKQGIDGIFEKDGVFYIVETKCCNGTSNKLKRERLTGEGTYQMDAQWIENRIEGLNISDELKSQIKQNYTPVLARVTEKGTVTYSKIIHNPSAKPSIPRGRASIVPGINGG